MDVEREDWAWAAGFFDAEGCFTMAGSYPALSLAQVDLEVLERFQRVLGAGNVRGPYEVAGRRGTFSRQPQYRFQLYAREALTRAALNMWPYLTDAKRTQARRVLPSEGWPSGSWDTPAGWDPVELAWAAGFMDGDGCFMYGKSYAAVKILQTDDQPLLRFKDVVRTGKIYGPRQPTHGANRRPVWEYVATGLEKSQAIAAMLWPWLGSAKKEQARRVLLLEAARRGVCHRGHRKPPRSRPCPECTRLYWARRRGELHEPLTRYAG